VSTTSAVVVAALGASSLTGLVTFGLDWWRARRTHREASQAALREACERLITAASMHAHRAGVLQQAALLRSGFPESLDIVLRHRKPVEVQDIADYQLGDLEAILAAQSTIWTLGDEPLIAGAGRVVMIAIEIISLSTVEIPQPVDDSMKSRAEARLRALRQAKLDPEKEKHRIDAINRLGRECRLFAQIMRQRLKTPDTEGLLRAFPMPSSESTGEVAGSQGEESDAPTTETPA